MMPLSRGPPLRGFPREECTMGDAALPEYVNGLPNLCGAEPLVARAAAGGAPVFLPESRIDFSRVRAGFAIALHMHQPLIPAGSVGSDGRTAEVISNLRHMAEHPEVPDAHNWSAFLNCYKRMGEFVPRLVAEGK